MQLVASESATDIMIAGSTPPRAEKYCLGSCYGRNCENWWRRACAWALQDKALFIIIEMGECNSIMFDTIFDGNEKQDHKKSIFESMQFLECAQSAAAPMITLPWTTACRARSQRGVPASLPRFPGRRPDHRHRAGQYAGHFFG